MKSTKLLHLRACLKALRAYRLAHAQLVHSLGAAPRHLTEALTLLAERHAQGTQAQLEVLEAAAAQQTPQVQAHTSGQRRRVKR